MVNPDNHIRSDLHFIPISSMNGHLTSSEEL
jgi:hypothetical protein